MLFFSITNIYRCQADRDKQKKKRRQHIHTIKLKKSNKLRGETYN